MTINIPIKTRIIVPKSFEYAYKKAIEKSTQHIVKTIKKDIPVKSGATRDALEYSIDWEKGEVRIGWKQNSKEELVGSVLQYGSGNRGRDNYSSQFGEVKPDYTSPIVPIRAKAMAFQGDDGRMHFMKSFEGHMPKYILTKNLKDSMKFLPIVFANNFNK